MALALLLTPLRAHGERITDPSADFSIELDTSEACVLVPTRSLSERCHGLDVEDSRTRCMKMNAIFCAAIPLTASDWNFVVITLAKASAHTKPIDPLDDTLVKEMARAFREPTAHTPGLEPGPARISSIVHEDGLERATIAFDVHGQAKGITRDMREVWYIVTGRDMLMLTSMVPASSAERADADMHKALGTLHLARRPTTNTPTAAAANARAYALGQTFSAIMGVQVAFIAIIVLLVEPWWIARMPKKKRKRRKKT